MIGALTKPGCVLPSIVTGSVMTGSAFVGAMVNPPEAMLKLMTSAPAAGICVQHRLLQRTGTGGVGVDDREGRRASGDRDGKHSGKSCQRR
jgi:hypothetical protein